MFKYIYSRVSVLPKDLRKSEMHTGGYIGCLQFVSGDFVLWSDILSVIYTHYTLC